MKASLILAPLLVALTFASYDPYAELAQLYKMQALEDALESYVPESNSIIDSPNPMDSWYWQEMSRMAEEPDVLDKASLYSDEDEGNVIEDDGELFRNAELRDQEHIEHSALHGYQSVSGGSAEQPPQVKTDKQLPAYCNPPNPCPVGKTAKDNCVENFENSATNNQKLLSEQDCPCDTEHMFSCPKGSKTVSSKGEGTAKEHMALNKVIAELSKMNTQDNTLENDPNFSSTKKRVTLVAKKSPEHSIVKRSEKFNPHLLGEKIRIAAKKDPNLAKSVMDDWNLP